MKNENVHMQALHRKLDVVLVRILRYNCSETDYSFREDSHPSRTLPSTRMRVLPSDPFSPPTIFFAPPPGPVDAAGNAPYTAGWLELLDKLVGAIMLAPLGNTRI